MAKAAMPAVTADGKLVSGKLPDGRWFLGSPDAPITLVDYSDFL